MASKKGSSKKKAEKASAVKAPAAFSDASNLVDSFDAVRAVEAALKANPKHCASLAPDVDESDLKDVLTARLRYGKIKISDLT